MIGAGAALSAGVGLVQGITNTVMQAKQFKYQKELNERLMQREDNAVQRRAADMEAAGLSKTLAAGGAAHTASMSAGSAPQVDMSAAQRGAEMMMAAIRQKSDIARSTAETALINAKQQGQDLANGFSIVKHLQDIEKHRADMYNVNWYRDRGLPIGSRYSDNYANALIARYEANRMADYIQQEQAKQQMSSTDNAFKQAYDKARDNSNYSGYGSHYGGER